MYLLNTLVGTAERQIAEKQETLLSEDIIPFWVGGIQSLLY